MRANLIGGNTSMAMAEILSSLAHRLNILNIQLVADGCGITLAG
jgi:hypothetical protein